MNRVEQILGEFEDDPMLGYNGKWMMNKDNVSFTRFFSTGFREVIHKGTLPNQFGEEEEGYIVSLGYVDNIFSKGYKLHENTREARDWADNRDEQDWIYLEDEKQNLMRRADHLQKKDKKNEYNPGF